MTRKAPIPKTKTEAITTKYEITRITFSSSKKKNLSVRPAKSPIEPISESNFPITKEAYEEASLLSPFSGTFKTFRHKLHIIPGVGVVEVADSSSE